jgi:DNA-damage-inducible protein J
MKDTVLHVRVNSEVKKDAEDILDKLGITTSGAINMFLKQVCLKKGLPFELTYNDYNDVTKAAIKDSYVVAENSPTYNSAEEMIKDAKNWKD